MRILTTLVLCIGLFTSTSVLGQLVLTQGQILEGFGYSNDTGIDIEPRVKLEEAVANGWYWEIIKPESMPEEWKFVICDMVSCWTEVTVTSPENAVNNMDVGSTFTYSVKLKPYGVAGQDTLKFRFYEVGTPEITMLELDLYFEVALASNTEEMADEQSFYVFPNPSHSDVSIYLTSDQYLKADFILTDHLGRVMKQFNASDINANNQLIIARDGLLSGTYFLISDLDGIQRVQKIVLAN